MDTTKGNPTGSSVETSRRRVEGLVSSPAAGTMDRAASMAGGKLESTADAIREKAPEEGAVGHAATVMADKLESFGSYLQEQGISGAIEDVEILIRRYPVQSLLLGVGLGYLLSRIRER